MTRRWFPWRRMSNFLTKKMFRWCHQWLLYMPHQAWNPNNLLLFYFILFFPCYVWTWVMYSLWKPCMAMHTTLIVFIFFILLIYWFWVYDYSNHDFGIYALNILASILKFLDVKEAGKLVFLLKACLATKNGETVLEVRKFTFSWGGQIKCGKGSRAFEEEIYNQGMVFYERASIFWRAIFEISRKLRESERKNKEKREREMQSKVASFLFFNLGWEKVEEETWRSRVLVKEYCHWTFDHLISRITLFFFLRF